MTPLRQRMIEDLKLKDAPKNTIDAYVRQVRQYAEYFHAPPDRLGREHVRQYLQAGAHAVHIATAAMQQPDLALRIREELAVER